MTLFPLPDGKIIAVDLISAIGGLQDRFDPCFSVSFILGAPDVWVTIPDEQLTWTPADKETIEYCRKTLISFWTGIKLKEIAN